MNKRLSLNTIFFLISYSLGYIKQHLDYKNLDYVKYKQTDKWYGSFWGGHITPDYIFYPRWKRHELIPC
jgi:hypothetical protein